MKEFCVLQDMLLRMPGISSKNVFRLMNRVDHLDHLVSLSLEELTGVLDSERHAQLLHHFLHREHRQDHMALATRPGNKHSAQGKSSKGQKKQQMGSKRTLTTGGKSDISTNIFKKKR